MSKIRVNELDTESGSSIAIAEGKRITADLLYGNSQQVNVNFTVPATENTIAPGGRWKIV